MHPLHPTLEHVLDWKGNGFDFIRFAAATGVVVAHAFPLAHGPGTAPPLAVFSSGQADLGSLCLAVFLVLSGVLVARSRERSTSSLRYLRARALRVLPGLAAMLLFCAFVLGPLWTELPLPLYWTEPDTYLYVLRNLSLFSEQSELPGVFAANAWPGVVHGSLWTLRCELVFYLLVAALGALGWLRGAAALGLWCAAALLRAWPLLGSLGSEWAELYLYFGAGLAFHDLRRHVRLTHRGALPCAVVLVSTALLGSGLVYAVATCGAYLVLYAASLRGLEHFGRQGDFSYGMYLYGFPVQQTVTALLGGNTLWWLNASISLPVSLALAALSWHLLEKHMLACKPLPAARAPALPLLRRAPAIRTSAAGLRRRAAGRRRGG